MTSHRMKNPDLCSEVVDGGGNFSVLYQAESRVMHLLAMGRSYAFVASKLGVGMGTVQTHVKRIYRKLGVRSKTEAAWKLYGKGMLLFLVAVNEVGRVFEWEEFFDPEFFVVLSAWMA